MAQILELRDINPTNIESDNNFLESAPKYKTYFDSENNLKNIKFIPKLNLSDYMVNNFNINAPLATKVSNLILKLI